MTILSYLNEHDRYQMYIVVTTAALNMRNGELYIQKCSVSPEAHYPMVTGISAKLPINSLSEF